ncbi:uncharacterized protein LOC128962821 [Oppia nitens]|uniref:uncharacterized protein LOC128962821 n=1 Tax=Oppia nitens TaxID=1686743 RepID=UPI0023DA1772|nr:uncharacterized protein LOC128962821 [Oppia nitens]
MSQTVANSSSSTDSSSAVKIVEKKYEFAATNQLATFLLIKFDQSFLLWIGESAAAATNSLTDLSLAIGAHSTPIVSTAGGGGSGGGSGPAIQQLSPGLASKLSRKYNKSRPVYVSVSHPMLAAANSGGGAADGGNDFIIDVNAKIIDFLNENL